MPDPISTFAFVIATLIGAVFHFVVGGNARRLAIFLMAAWVGFALGHLIGNTLGVELLMIGELRMLPAAAGAMFALFVAYVLTTDRSARRSSN
jgi:hypothetical protein